MIEGFLGQAVNRQRQGMLADWYRPEISYIGLLLSDFACSSNWSKLQHKVILPYYQNHSISWWLWVSDCWINFLTHQIASDSLLRCICDQACHRLENSLLNLSECCECFSNLIGWMIWQSGITPLCSENPCLCYTRQTDFKWIIEELLVRRSSTSQTAWGSKEEVSPYIRKMTTFEQMITEQYLPSQIIWTHHVDRHVWSVQIRWRDQRNDCYLKLYKLQSLAPSMWKWTSDK